MVGYNQIIEMYNCSRKQKLCILLLLTLTTTMYYFLCKYKDVDSSILNGASNLWRGAQAVDSSGAWNRWRGAQAVDSSGDSNRWRGAQAGNSSLSSGASFQETRTLIGRKLAYPITIVTGYFKFEKAKHSFEEYDTWMENFLPHVSTPMVIFTDRNSSNKIQRLRNDHPSIVLEYDSVWDMPSPISAFKERYHKDQYEIDPEKSIHSPELYAIWNLKPWMLTYATELNFYGSKFFYWVDIGCFRTNSSRRNKWPDLDKVNQVFDGGAINKLHIFLAKGIPFPHKGENVTFEEISSTYFTVGTFFGGPLKICQWWSSIFYRTHNELIEKNLFVGKDQNIMTFILTRNKNYFFVTYNPFKGYMPECGSDPWFYFQNWYSNDQEKDIGCKIPPLNKYFVLT